MDVPFKPEPRRVYHCRKDTYAVLKVLDHYAEALGVDPAHNLAGIFLEAMQGHGCEDCREFLGEVYELMQEREFATHDDLFILHDEVPDHKKA